MPDAATYKLVRKVGSEEWSDGETVDDAFVVDGPGAPFMVKDSDGEDVPGAVRFGRKKSSKFEPPSEGDEKFGTVYQDKRGNWRFRYAKKGSGGGDDAGRFDRKPEHPENAARMRHTSALSATPTYIEQMLTIGVVDQPKTLDEYRELVARTILWLLDTYPGVPEPPAQPELAANGASKADEDIPFRRPEIPDLEARRRDLFVGDKF